MSPKKLVLTKILSRGFTFVLFGVAMTTLPITACNRATPAQEPVVTTSYTITGVAVVDVEKGIVLPDQTVIIMGEHIQAVVPQAELSAPEGSHVIDGRGLYVMPGLVDAHVHYFDPEVFGRVMIANGVLLVRDMGQPTEQALSQRDALNRGEKLGPEMIATGSILDGYPALIPAIALGLKTPDEARAAVRRQAEAGVDMIKVYSRLDKEVFLAIADEARKVGLPVVGHVPESVYIEDAAAAGLRSSEHLFGFEKVIGRLLGEYVTTTYAGMGSDAGYLQRLDEVNPEELLSVYRRLRDSGLTVCPTVITFKTGVHTKDIQSGSFLHSEYISPGILDIWRSQWSQQSDLPDFIWQNWAQMVSELNRAGVPLMVGTDLITPGIIPGYAVHEEMAIWQEAGIPPANVLRSATLVPAQFMGLDNRLGTVAEGKSASLVLLRANPLEDIRNAQLIEAVFLRGQYYSRDDLNQLLGEAKELAKP
jgi:imidazolonepropionase-like amidohydrolase